MDLGNIVYIVAVLAYFIYQATKGKKRNQEADSEPMTDESSGKPTSFEDLLREIREAQQPKSHKKPAPARNIEQPKPEESYPWRDDEPEEKYQQEWKKKKLIYEAEPADDEIQYYSGAFEQTKSELSKTSKGVPEIPTAKQAKDEKSYQASSKYARMLKNPQGIRDAVVMKEILDRKYF
ncbi:hypothetical protein [Algoriphagus halophytocola]|uniref:Uncharacterized protein n=1 Tax=Algoriphagus halophytocola TaxID=2991499 RepID=A0ABY6MM16_9BACT|nr:hypothetical protein [Algoriphagus sp. TR-M5]UZD23437.1 hypothetical protein OM944_02880 [Algoriphagus sp. TR-M5]